jgi:adenylosuccinate synthase
MARNLNAPRNSDRVIAMIKSITKQYMNGTDLDFAEIYISIYEAGFNLHIQRNHGCSCKGTTAKSIAPTGKGITFTIFDAISQAGIICVELKNQNQFHQRKERQIVRK